MSPGVGFVLFLIITLGLLGAVVLTGFRGRLVSHLSFVGAAVVSLGVTIYWAEQLGELYDLEASGWIYPFHLWCAKITVVAYLLPVATGLLTLRNIEKKPIHRFAAFAVLGLTVLTAVTGTWMLSASEPVEQVASER
ncbi:MAG: hypothetical protein RL885_30390 [Planctomycetota bacterium]